MGDVLYWTWDIWGKWAGVLSEGAKTQRQERHGGQSPDIWSKELEPEKEQKESHLVPALHVKDDLIVFILAYFFSFQFIWS